MANESNGVEEYFTVQHAYATQFYLAYFKKNKC